jgi:hypothetical protein
MKLPGERVEPSRVLLLDLLDLNKATELDRASRLQDCYLVPLAFSPDDRTLAVRVDYWIFGDQWYKPIVKWLLDADRPVHLLDVSSGWCLARLPGTSGTDVIFTLDGKTAVTGIWNFRPLTASQDGKPILPPGDFPIRVYDYPMRVPVPAILMWAMLPTAAAAILLGGFRYLLRSRKRSQPTPDQPHPSVGPGGGEVADGLAVGPSGSDL